MLVTFVYSLYQQLLFLLFKFIFYKKLKIKLIEIVLTDVKNNYQHINAVYFSTVYIDKYGK